MDQIQAKDLNEGTRLIVERVNFFRDSKNNSLPTLVVIAGGSCSGKSLLALMAEEAIKKAGLKVSTFGLDDYYNSTDDPNFPLDDCERFVFDLPASFADSEFQANVKRLLKGFNVKGPLYDKQTHQRSLTRYRSILANPVIIPEGLFAIRFLARLKHDNAFSVFIETDPGIRLARRIKRDTGSLHPTAEATAQFVTERVEPYYQDYVRPQLKKADLVVINN